VFEQARRLGFFPTARQAEHIRHRAVKAFERRVEQLDMTEESYETVLPALVDEEIRHVMRRAGLQPPPQPAERATAQF
jgi:hypothetical protein